MIQPKENGSGSRNASVAMANVYRRFTKSLSAFSDFQSFTAALSEAIQEDSHLASFLLSERVERLAIGGDTEVFEKGQVVVPLRGSSPNGYIKVTGRRDRKPFGPADLQLMGSMAGFVSALYSQADIHRKLKGEVRILQFLIDQLPLGIVCFDAQGELLAGNHLSWKQLGLEQKPADAASAPILGVLRDGVGDGGEAHFEVEGRLMFAIRRVFEPKADEPIAAYVIYDLSKRRERLLDSLDREYYKSRCLNSAVTIGLLQCNTAPGAVYNNMKHSASALHLNQELIQPLDAYTCACVFPDKRIPGVRALLAKFLRSSQLEGLRVSLVAADDDPQGSPAANTIQVATEKLQPFKTALLPQLLVLDAYRPVFETLEMMLEEMVGLVYCSSADSAIALMRTGQYDGIILEVDLIDSAAYHMVSSVADVLGSSFKLIHSSIQQRAMLSDRLGLRAQTEFLQKPFDADFVVDAVSLLFDLA